MNLAQSLIPTGALAAALTLTSPALAQCEIELQSALSRATWQIETAGNHVFVAHGHYIYALDATDPLNPSVTNAVALGNTTTGVQGFHVEGNTLFISRGSGCCGGFATVDISDPDNMQLLAAQGRPFSDDVVVSGTTAFLLTGNWPGWVEAIDVSDPANPTTIPQASGQTGLGPIAADPRAIEVHGSYLFVADNKVNSQTPSLGMKLIDATDPADLSFVALPGAVSALEPFDLALAGDHLYVTTYVGDLYVLDVSTPTAPVIVGSVAAPLAAAYAKLKVAGTTVYVSAQAHVWTVDVADPTQPTVLRTYAGSVLGRDIGVIGPAMYWGGLGGFQVLANVEGGVVQPEPCGSAPPNDPPTADAGEDQAIRAGDSVQLDGSGSFDDNTANAALTWSWSFASKPAGSTATLAAADTETPSFVADLAGCYTLELVVTDEGGLSSAPAQVKIDTNNLAPTAVADGESLVFLGQSMTLDGSGSTDPENDALTYSWTVTAAPAGSAATISGDDQPVASFTPDVAGSYTFELSVADALGAGAPAVVTMTSTSAQSYAETAILCGAMLVEDLGPNQVTNKGNQRAFLNHLRQATEAIQAGDIAEAIAKLEQCIERTNGCEAGGAPDGNGGGRDWITDCIAQAAILDCLRDALLALSLL